MERRSLIYYLLNEGACKRTNDHDFLHQWGHIVRRLRNHEQPIKCLPEDIEVDRRRDISRLIRCAVHHSGYLQQGRYERCFLSFVKDIEFVTLEGRVPGSRIMHRAGPVLL